MSSSRRHLPGWIAFAVPVAVGAVFLGSLIHGIVAGDGTTHRTDLANHVLDQSLVELAREAATAEVAALPFAAADPSWDVVCYVDTGAWVGRAVADDLGLALADLTFEPRNVYVVDGYWGLAFYDIESGVLRITELGRHPVAVIEGPSCLSRDDARVSARPLDGAEGDIVVSFVGTPATVQ